MADAACRMTGNRAPVSPQVRKRARAEAAVEVGRVPSTQEERRAASERRLIAAACDVLARKGWIGMTLAEVGQRAGVSRGLASHHFGNKAGLLRAITLQIHESFSQALEAAPPAEPGLAGVLRFVAVYLSRTDPRWTTTRTLLLLMAEALVEGSENAPVLAGYVDQMFSYLEENIRAGIEKGEMPPDLSPVIGAEMVIGMLRGMMLQRLVRGDFGDMAELRDQVLQLISRSLSIPR